MSEEDIRNTRKESRKEVRDRIKMQRKSMNRDDAVEKSEEIAEKLFGSQDFRDASTTAFYAEKHEDREVCTEEMIKRSMRMQKTIALPVSYKAERRLRFFKIENYSELYATPKNFYIPEPIPNEKNMIAESDFDLVIVPGIAFNLNGYRLGWGFGFYDDFLSRVNRKTKRIGLAYELQIADFPVESHDIPVDKIITEKRIVECTYFRK
ncbi:MAG: 5-formyltetrahydrofolate cyclo-ligase [Candidatus Bathyarchaeia archaeon]